MEDYLLREIEKVRKILEALLAKMGVSTGALSIGASVCEAAKTELNEELALDTDALLESENFVDVLIKRHGFNNGNLEQFAELLFGFTTAEQDEASKRKLALNIRKIYEYLDENEKSVSFNRFHILEELKKYL